MSKTKKKRSYTEEFKASVLQKLEEPNNTITSLSDELGVPRPTIYQWIKKAEADNMKVSINHKVTSKWTSEDKFVRSQVK